MSNSRTERLSHVSLGPLHLEADTKELLAVAALEAVAADMVVHLLVVRAKSSSTTFVPSYSCDLLTFCA